MLAKLILVFGAVVCSVNCETMQQPLVVVANSELDIDSSFEDRFGSVRKTKFSASQGDFLAVFHDRGSGIVREDIFIYQKNEKKWELMFFVSLSSTRAKGLMIQGNYLLVVDEFDAPIASTKLE